MSALSAREILRLLLEALLRDEMASKLRTYI